MKNEKIKIKSLKFLIFAASTFFVFFAAGSALALIDASLPLPMGAAEAPAGSAAVKQIYLLFQFGLGTIGIVAFGSVIYGAVKYMAAAGDPSAITEAKGRIFSALWGIGIALTSIILLGTINPDLVNFLGTGEFSVPAIKYKQTCGGSNPGSCAKGTSCLQMLDGKTYQCMTTENYMKQINSAREKEKNDGLIEPETSIDDSANDPTKSYY